MLVARGIVKLLGGLRVLRGVDAEFGSGLHVIEGANGAGKSTFLSIVGGRLAATSGEVSLQMEKTNLRGRALREVAGWLGHELGLYPDLTAFENHALHCRLRGVRPLEEWNRISAPLALDSLRERRVRELSRGQRQRVGLGRALVGTPPVLLLDEPSTGLDATSLNRLTTMLEELAADGLIVLIVTHDEPFRNRLDAKLWRLGAGKLEPREAVGEGA